MSNSFKDQSRVSWQPVEDRQVTNEEINTGCLQRIADATEAMAKNHIKLQYDLDQYKRWYEQERKSNGHMARRIAALQGVITKLKKKAGIIIPIILLFAACHPARYLECPPAAKITGDTIHEQMLVTLRPMGFAFSRYGLAIVRDDTCRAHLYCDGRQIKRPVTVWDCETERKRRVR